MRVPVSKTLSLVLLCIVAGATICVRWSLITMSSAQMYIGFNYATPVAVKTLSILLAVGLLAAYRIWKSSFLFFCAVAISGTTLFYLMQCTAVALQQVWYPAILILVLVAVPAIAVALIRRKYALASTIFVCVSNLVPHIVSLLMPMQERRPDVVSAPLLTGDAVAVAAARSQWLPSPLYWVYLMLSVCALFATVAVVRALTLKRDMVRNAAWGWILGALIGLWFVMLQLAYYSTTLYSGFNFPLVLLVFLFLHAMIAVLTCIAVRAVRSRSRYVLLKTAPLVMIALLFVFLGVALYGTGDYERLDSYHNDSSWAYLHYDSVGGWRRTLDHSSSSIRLWRTQRFIETYPNSVYKPAALLRLAEFHFDAWQFDEAARVLSTLQNDYPCLRSRAQIMRSMVDLAQGKTGAMLKPVEQAPYFDTWRRSQGAQLAAFAAVRGNQPAKALGYFSFYIDFLKRRQSAAWIQPSLAFANLQADDVISKQRSRAYPTQRSMAAFRIVAGTRPIRGARIVLVQPRFDAALPNDSRQFTGAWSIPAWNGYYGITGDDGTALIRNISCGKYEVVVGLDYRMCPPGYVVSQPAGPVTLCAGETKQVDIHLVPGIDLVSPRNGDVIGSHSTLRWNKYPGAAWYSVSIIRVARSKGPDSCVSLGSSQKTCWAKPGIRSCQTPIEPRYFLGGTKSLEPGGLYMWVVYAYRSDGSMLSSSEHYFDIRETVFSVH